MVVWHKSSDLDRQFLSSRQGKKNSVTVNVLKSRTLFPFPCKMLVFSAGIHKILVRIANRVDPDQTASSEEAV